MKGKNKCKILKQIRQKIADENDIPYVTRECSYQGECRGTCPKCEAELRYLEQELEKRRRLGKSVAVAAVAAGLSLTLAACQPKPAGGSGGSPGGETVQTQPAQTQDPEIDQVVGLVTADPDCTEATHEPLEGEPALIDDPTEGLPEPLEGEPEYIPPEETDLLAGETEPFEELEGDIAMIPDTESGAPGETAVPSDQGGENHG